MAGRDQTGRRVPAASGLRNVTHDVRVGQLVEQLRAEGHVIDDATLAQTTPLMRKHLNPFGRYHFNLERMRQTT